MRLETADGLQVVPEVAAVRHEALRIPLIHTLPPQIEEQQMVLEGGEMFFHFGFEGPGLELFCIFGEPQVRVGSEPARIPCKLFREGEEIEERLFGHSGRQLCARRFEAGDFRAQVFQITVELFHRVGDKVGEFPMIGKLTGGGRTT